MRIGLEITGAFAGGGYRRYIESLLQAMAEQEPLHEFFLYGMFWRGFPERALRLSLPRGAHFHWALKRFPQGLLFPIEEYCGARFQERFLRSLNLDLLHGLGSILPRLDRLRSVVTLHYSGPVDFRGTWNRFYFNRLTSRSVRQADRVIAISEFARQEALKSWGLDSRKVTTIYHGGAGRDFVPDAQSRDPRPDVRRPYFLFIGTLSRFKNPGLLVEAFGIIKERWPRWPHRLVLAGPAGDRSKEVRWLARRWDISAQMDVLGPVDPASIHRLYQQAEAVVCPCPLEGFSFPVIEAMACGTPVIGVRAGALVETIGGAGLLADPTPQALAAQMERVVREENLRTELRRLGMERARRFSWERTAKETLGVYEEVAHGA